MLCRALLLVCVVIFFAGACGGGGSSRHFVMQGQAMSPTLDDGDQVAVEEYGSESPQRGDIILFHPPTESGEPSDLLFLKRIVGLPGETIEIRQQAVLVDGSELAEPYIAEPTAGTFDLYLVPTDAYFVMGDNRNNSSDSRSYSAIPKDSIIGRANVERS